MTTATETRRLEAASAAIRRVLSETFPDVTFTGIWVRPRESPYGDEVLEICAVYEGEADQLQTPGRPRLLARIADELRDLGMRAVPSTRFIARDNAEDWKPEGF